MRLRRGWPRPIARRTDRRRRRLPDAAGGGLRLALLSGVALLVDALHPALAADIPLPGLGVAGGVVGLAIPLGVWLYRANQQQEEAERMRAAAAQAPASVTPPQPLPPRAAPADDADVTVFGPGEAAPGQRICVQVFIHRPRQAKEAEQKAIALEPEASALASAPLTVQLLFADKVRIAIDAGGAQVEPATHEFVWMDAVVQTLFFITLPAIAQPDDAGFRPKVFIYVNGVPSGYVTFRVAVKAIAPDTGVSLRNETARRYRRAFLSYASEDRVHVLRSAQFLAAMKVEFFHDLLTLEPGDDWEEQIYREIDACDLFLLFWSRHAAASRWVVKEVEHALKRIADGAPADGPDIHPVILEGPPPVRPPPELAALHFNDPVRYVIFANEMAAAPGVRQLPEQWSLTGGKRPAGRRWVLPVLAAATLAACVFPFVAARFWLSAPAHMTRLSGQLEPAAGYAWTDASKTAVRWAPGSPYGPRWPHVVASDEEGKWEPAPGYEFANDTAGDYTVVPAPAEK